MSTDPRHKMMDEEDDGELAAKPALPADVVAEVGFEVQKHCAALRQVEDDRAERSRRRDQMAGPLELLVRIVRHGFESFLKNCEDEDRVTKLLTQGHDVHLWAAWAGRLRVLYSPDDHHGDVIGYYVRMLDPRDDETYIPLPALVAKHTDLATLDGLDLNQACVAVMRLLLQQPALRKYRTSDGIETVHPPGVVHWEPKALDYRVNRAYWTRYDAANGKGHRR